MPWRIFTASSMSGGLTTIDCLFNCYSFGEMVFLRNKSFSGLMVWWYECAGINFFVEEDKSVLVTGKKRKSSL